MHFLGGLVVDFRRLITISFIFFSQANFLYAFDVLQALPEKAPIPDGIVHNQKTIELGKLLFFDPRLSGLSKQGQKQISCNYCHNLLLGADSGNSLSLGVNNQMTERNAPTLWNVAFQTVLFWDGRAKNLESAIKTHLNDGVITDWHTAADLASQLNGISGYRQKFKEAYSVNEIKTNDIANALASFIRTLITPDSPFDRFILGNEKSMSHQAQQGLNEFKNIGCMACHFGVTFSGPAPGPFLKMGDGFYELFPNYRGSRYETKYKLSDDEGRITYSGIDTDKYMFRVPPLRNIAITGPYFHNGSVATLTEAIRVMARTELNTVLDDEQVYNIRSFLIELTGQRPSQVIPILPSVESQ